VALLDVNALVALGWDSHVHHRAIRDWFLEHSDGGWHTCPSTESGFVRVSSNPKVIPDRIDVASAIRFLAELKKIGQHRFLTDEVSVTDADFPDVHGYRQVTDAHLLTIARRNRVPLLTFDTGLTGPAKPGEAIVLTA
jgi:toxin-antitoxin system PIN domain toxin